MDIEKSTKKPKPKARKRGRKPHGGVVISKNDIKTRVIPTPNMVVHLKCHISDLTENLLQVVPTKYDPTVEPIVGYSEASLQYEEIANEKIDNDPYPNVPQEKDATKDTSRRDTTNDECISKTKYTKLCFYCGCGDRQTNVSIPVSETESMGQFCRPECAAGFLMKHTSDVSTRYDRYQRLNSTYGTEHKQIKIAPEPYFLLNHYCGEMTSSEYHAIIGECDVIENSNMIRIIPRVVNETDNTTGDAGNNHEISTSGKYQVRTASNFFNTTTKI